MCDEPLELTRFPELRASQHFAFFNSHFAFCIHLRDSQIQQLFILDPPPSTAYRCSDGMIGPAKRKSAFSPG
jgi:hypothetical protein